MTLGERRIKWIQDNINALEGVNIGMVDASIPEKYFRYCMYLNLISEGVKSHDAVFITAQKTRVSEMTIYRAISFFTE